MFGTPKKQKPDKTLADYLVIGISPILIILLVGSLVLFLIQVFYHGANVVGIRWLMFWFVIAIVLVSRIGIEQGTVHGSIYGLALAAATWLYLLKTHPAFLIGLFLLAVVWWSANRLVYDCTLIDDDQDASGQGLLQPKKSKTKTTSKGRHFDWKNTVGRTKSKQHTPGVWVVFFSLAALPLFGVGQMLLPEDDVVSRRTGFTFLFIYMSAALGLLLSTSFLGLRRYLRQRFVMMSPAIAFGWIKSGASVAIVVLLLSLMLPRPGAGYSWTTLSGQVDTYLRKASNYATKSNPPGEGEGRAGNQAERAGDDRARGGGQEQQDESRSGNQGKQGSTSNRNAQSQNDQRSQSQSGSNQAQSLYNLLKWILIIGITLFVSYLMIRHRHLLNAMLVAFWRSLTDFFRRLLSLDPTIRSSSKSLTRRRSPPKPRPFAAYPSPFATGKDKQWTPQELVAYSFEALQAWAREYGIEPKPEQTPAEYGRRLTASLPQISPWADRLVVFYSHAAYSTRMPNHYDPQAVQQLWNSMTEAYHR